MKPPECTRFRKSVCLSCQCSSVDRELFLQNNVEKTRSIWGVKKKKKKKSMYHALKIANQRVCVCVHFSKLSPLCLIFTATDRTATDTSLLQPHRAAQTYVTATTRQAAEHSPSPPSS